MVVEVSTSVVYFFINEQRNLIKIGRTNNINNRLLSLRQKLKEDILCCGCFDGYTYSQTVKIETALHHRFYKYRNHGEWFERNPVEFYILNTPQITFPKKDYGCSLLYDLRACAEIQTKSLYARKYGDLSWM